MNKITLLVLLIFSSISFSQENKLDEFKKNLIQVKNVDSLKIIEKEIQNIEKLINPNDTLIKINESTKWKLICYSENGWEEIVGRPRINFNYKYTYNSHNVLNTSDVFGVFNMKYDKEIIQKQYPLVINRDDIFNRKTIPILINNQYLTFRYVHSYPNGNQTSWYRVMTYYFKKIED